MPDKDLASSESRPEKGLHPTVINCHSVGLSATIPSSTPTFGNFSVRRSVITVDSELGVNLGVLFYTQAVIS